MTTSMSSSVRALILAARAILKDSASAQLEVRKLLMNRDLAHCNEKSMRDSRELPWRRPWLRTACLALLEAGF